MTTLELYFESSETGIRGEWLLCEQLEGEGKAKIISVPFSTDAVSPGDIVSYSENRITGVLEKLARSHHRTVKVGKVEAFIDYFKRCNICCEQLAKDYFGFGIPANISESNFEDLLDLAQMESRYGES